MNSRLHRLKGKQTLFWLDQIFYWNQARGCHLLVYGSHAVTIDKQNLISFIFLKCCLPSVNGWLDVYKMDVVCDRAKVRIFVILSLRTDKQSRLLDFKNYKALSKMPDCCCSCIMATVMDPHMWPFRFGMHRQLSYWYSNILGTYIYC